jgi:hypothetical protein
MPGVYIVDEYEEVCRLTDQVMAIGQFLVLEDFLY